MLKSALRGRVAQAVCVTMLTSSFALVASSGADAAPVTRPARASVVYYTVQRGDALSVIARGTRTPLATILSLNKLTVSSRIWPGMRLKLPATATVPKVVYVIRSGDTYAKIAAATKVSVEALLAENPSVDSRKIYAGRKLVLPAGGVLPAGQRSPMSAAAASAGRTPSSTKPSSTKSTTKPTAKPTSSTTSTTVKPSKSGSNAAAATYTVKRGDALYLIARRAGVRLTALLEANRLTVTSLILPGQVLVLPAGATAPSTGQSAGSTTTTTTEPSSPSTSSSSSGVRKYTIRSGDALYGIASRAGVKLSVLLSMNDLTVTSKIRPGMVLVLPASADDPAVGAPGGTPTDTMPDDPKEAVDRVVSFARDQLGKPYLFFAAGPDAYDCSGLTMAAYLTVGIKLPHQSAKQATRGTAVDISDIRAGDLIFTKSSSGTAAIGHVELAVSGTSSIHAPRTGDVVRYRTIPKDRIVAVRRYI